MLRSAATAGASLADAETNANAAVLAHSVLFIPNLDATHPALENRHRRAPARGSINWRDCAADFRELWRERHRCSLPAVFQPVFQVLAGRGTLAVAGLGKRAGIHLSNPRLVRAGGVLRYDEPKQPERSLAGNLFALEQHAAEQRLRPVIAFIGGQAQPARRLDRVLGCAFAEQVEPSELVLGLGVRVIRGGVAEHLARDVGIGLQRSGDAVEMIEPQSH